MPGMTLLTPRSLAMIAALSIAWASAAEGQADRTGTAPTRSGSELFDAACATCHGGDGHGRSQSQLGFPTPVPDFTDCDFAAREPNSDWGAIIHQGGPVRGFDRMMPAFGAALTEQEIDAVLERVREFCTDADWPRGELNLPRPLFTEKAYPEDEAVVTANIATEGPDSMTYTFLWEQRFGTRNQIEISLPVSRTDLGDPLGWESGAGDLAIGIKRAFHHSLERGSIFAAGAELKLPTGDEARGFGSGTTIFEPFLAYGKLLGRSGFVQLHALAEFPSDRNLDDEAALRLAFGRSWTGGGAFGRQWTPMIEILAARDLKSGAETHLDLVPQFQVTLSRRQHIMASAGFRQPANNRSTRQGEFVFYLLWDWFDGGVLEGW